MLLRVFYYAFFISVALGYKQTLTYYSEPDSGGNALQFQTKEPDLTLYWPILREFRSFCYQGFWHGFSEDSVAWIQITTIRPLSDIFLLMGQFFAGMDIYLEQCPCGSWDPWKQQHRPFQFIAGLIITRREERNELSLG
ncbi:uncharacterized protein LOC110860368 [Folsomia candida]|uniref:uncharacterized protein LOC110860368 n=1 Tax=Folsomia candida TaxID=158441 RepID=UPI000B8F39E0|nr:uncharacterized protein LOC110860368 [Folsomia candida]